MARYASKGSIHVKSAKKEMKQTDEEESNGEYDSEENNTEDEGIEKKNIEEYIKAEKISTFDGLHDWSIAMNADEALVKRMKRFIAAWIDDN